MNRRGTLALLLALGTFPLAPGARGQQARRLRKLPQELLLRADEVIE